MIPEDDAAELVELLAFIAALCQNQRSAVSAALHAFMGTAYAASDLGADAARLAGVVARAVGLAEPATEQLP